MRCRVSRLVGPLVCSMSGLSSASWSRYSISAVVDDFRDRVAKDHRINQKFAKTDIGRLKKMLVDQVCEASGGPCKYTGRTMRKHMPG